MNNQAEIIGMLMPEADNAHGHERAEQACATLLLRNPDGQMSLQTVSTDSTLGQFAMSTGYFRKGKPIFDPVSRQILGYEMEMVPCPLAEIG